MESLGAFQKTRAVRTAQSHPVASAESRYWNSYKVVECNAHVHAVSSMTFSPVDPFDLALVSSTRVHVYHGTGLRLSKNITKFKDTVVSCAFRHDGALIAAGTKDRRLKVFDVASRALLKEFRGHADTVRVCHFSSLSPVHIASGSDDGTARIWDLSTGACITTLAGHSDQVRAMVQSGSSWITGSYDHTVRVWDVRTGQAERQVRLSGPVSTLALLGSAGSMFAVGCTLGLDIVDMLSDRVLHHVAASTAVTCVAVQQRRCGSHEQAGQHGTIITGAADQHLQFFDATTFEARYSMSMPAAIVSVAVRDNALAVGMADGQVAFRLRPLGQVPSALPAPNPGTKRYFMRGCGKVPATDDYRIRLSTGPSLQPYDQHLKRYEFGAALDAALHTLNPMVVAALLHELRARQALTAAVSGRDHIQLQPLVKFVTRHILEPSLTPILHEIIDCILDVYGDLLAHSPLIAPLVSQLAETVSAQVDLTYDMTRLAGQIHLLSN